MQRLEELMEEHGYYVEGPRSYAFPVPVAQLAKESIASSARSLRGDGERWSQWSAYGRSVELDLAQAPAPP